MPKKSAGLLVHRDAEGGVEVFLVHPGGPFWANKDDGAWSIPKGEFSENDDPLEAAKREFEEETSFVVTGKFEALVPLKQPSGKIIYAWLVKGDVNADAIRSNLFSMEWPPHSGTVQEFPEVDRAGWFMIEAARRKILKGQLPLLDQLEQRVSKGTVGAPVGAARSKPRGHVESAGRQRSLFEK